MEQDLRKDVADALMGEAERTDGKQWAARDFLPNRGKSGDSYSK